MESKGKKIEEKSTSGNLSKVVGAFATGAVVGVVTGILIAPDKGKKTREKLLEDAKDLTDKLKKKAEDGLSSITDKE